MKTKFSLRKRILFLSVALAVASSPLMMNDDTATSFFIDDAVAASDHDGGHQGMGPKGSAGKGAMRSDKGKGGGMRKGKTSVSELLADDGDDDSDRPDWAGVPGKEGKPGDGSSGSDTQKGTDYGDLVVMLRNDDGTIYVDENGITYAVAPDGTRIALIDGEIPGGADVQAVEYGRLNIARAPSKVLDHSLIEALSKLDGGEWGVTITLDPAGRLVIDGFTIDSPLENLAIYEALLITPAVDGFVTLSASSSHDGQSTTYTLTIPESERLDLAASALAAASDKTGTLLIDEVVGISGFVDAADELASLVPTYTYDRQATYDGVMVDILVEKIDGDGNPYYVIESVNLYDAVEWNSVETNSIETNNPGGIDVFTQAADDAVQALEFVHDNAVQ